MSKNQERSLLRRNRKIKVSPFQDKKGRLRQPADDTPNFRITRCRQLEGSNGVALERVHSQTVKHSSSQAAHHLADDVVLVPDYQIRGIELFDDLCSFPEFTAVGTILCPKRQREVMVKSLSGTVPSLFPRSREICEDERSCGVSTANRDRNKQG
jgi:hypothetical protein